MISQHGQMPFGGLDTLYTCDNAGGCRVEVHVVNEHTGQIGINLWIKDTATVPVDRAICPKNFQLNSGAHAYSARPIYMRNNETIEGQVDTAGNIAPYHVLGIEIGKDEPGP